MDTSGNVYVADAGGHTIRKISPAGAVTTLAGSFAISGSTDGTGSAARFFQPMGLAVDGVGNVYVADTANHAIRKITPGGVVTTLAGLAGSHGSTDGLGSVARFYFPWDVAVDPMGNIFVADSYNYTIRMITSAGVVITLAGIPGNSGSADGTGSDALFGSPLGLTMDSAGNLYFADGGNTIRWGSLAPPALTSATTVNGAFGQSFTYTVTFSHALNGYSANGLPSGLSFDATTGVISGTPTVSGIFPITLSATNSAGTGTATLTLIVIVKNSQTITFGPLVDKVYGDAPFSVNATASSGLTPTYSIVSGPATITGNLVTLTGAGTVIVRASQGGDSNYNAAANVDQSFTVPPPYSATHISGLGGTSNGTQAFGNGINNYGAVVGTSYLSGTNVARAFIYANGTTTDLGTLGGTASYGSGINDSGAVVGGSRISGDPVFGVNFVSHAFVFSNGMMTDLGTLGRPYSYATSINNAGTITGQSDTALGPTHAFIYSNSHMVDIGTLYGSFSILTYGTSINNSGMVAGYGMVNSIDHHPFIYANGTMNHFSGLASAARSINDAGTATGEMYYADNTGPNAYQHAFVYSSGTTTDIGTLGGTNSWAYGINASGTIVGQAQINGGVYHAFVYSSGLMTDLNSLVSLPGVTLTVARAVNEGGQIVANGSNGECYLLTPPLHSPVFAIQPSNQTAVAGSSVTLMATAAGLPMPTYQWQKNGVNIIGATSNSYTITNVATTDAGSYTVSVTNSLGAATSNTATLVVNVPPAITTQPIGHYVTVDANVTLTIAASGFPTPTYQWKKAGVDIAGATAASYTITNAQLADAGVYTVVVTNLMGTATSNATTLTVTAASLTPVPADFNNDGKPDIVWRNNNTGAIAFWFMNGTAYQSALVVGAITTDWQIAGTGDFNNDGQTDLLWRKASTGAVAIWYMNGTAMQSSVFLANITADWAIAGTGDFNHDGKTDILWRKASSGAVALWLMDGATILSTPIFGNITADWIIGGAGDFNGDGETDILWRKPSTGKVAYWYLNGTTILSTPVIATITADWVITGTADLNQDGRMDILWRQPTTGKLAYWLMDGDVILSSGLIATITTDWQVEN